MPAPAALAAEKIPQLPDSDGYDGQFYRYIAHDPLLSKGLARYVDDPGLRWLAFFALSAAMLGSPKVWAGGYAFARVLSPWLVFLLLVAIRDRRYWFALPCVLMELHVAGQAAVHLLGIFRHVLNA